MAFSWPFDSTVSYDTEGNPLYSRTYSADVLAKILALYFRNGVYSTLNSAALQVLANADMTVLVQSGAANINGRQFYEESDRVLTVQAANASLDRIDTVVVRLNLSISALTVDLYVVQGTAAATPTAPDLTRNANIWELGLADLFIAKNTTTITQQRITDTRLDTDRCGVVASIIGDTDTTAYYAQIQADLAAFKAGSEADFGAWFALIQNTLGEDTAGNLLNLINYHAPLSYTATLPASGWSASAPYTQTVTVTGLLSTDTPFIDAALSNTAETAMAQLEAWGYVGRIVTGTDQITATCYEDKPQVDIPVAMKVVR